MNRQYHLESERGTALVMSLLMLAGLLAMGAAFLLMSTATQRRVESGVDDDHAFLLAEAGLNEALTSMRGGASGSMGSMAAPVFLGDGAFWVESTDLADGRKRLRVTAMAASGREAIEVIARPPGPEDPLFLGTLNSDETMTLNEDVRIDSFDSSLGTYLSQATGLTSGVTHANTNGHVFSNQDILMNARAKLFGDAVPGPGHSVSLATDSFVYGSTTPSDTAFAFPPIAVPPIAAAGSLVLPVGDSATLGPGDHGLSSIDIGKDATLTVTGPANIVVADFTGGRFGRLEIDATAGPVTIYCTNSYTHIKEFEAVPVAGSPMALAFMLDVAHDIVFPSATLVRGAYYAPNSEVTFTAGNEMWGAVAAKRVSMSSGMSLHFDETLLDHWTTDTGTSGETAILAWSRVSVEPATLRSDRRDAFAVLGVDPASLPTPAQAWDL